MDTFTSIFDVCANGNRDVIVVVNRAGGLRQAAEDAAAIIAGLCPGETEGRSVALSVSFAADVLRNLHLAPGSIMIYHGRKIGPIDAQHTNKDLPAPLNTMSPAAAHVTPGKGVEQGKRQHDPARENSSTLDKEKVDKLSAREV